jgi:hypothetical protein
MRAAPALRVAIDLMHVPSRVRLVRSDPLPDGVLMLLQIAAGDQEAISLAAEMTDRSHDVVHQAAGFFIEQILLGPDTDSYRRLAANTAATASELRRNMALLLRWLHPDLDREGERSLFARRVIGAWDDLKTPERRAAYDEARRNLTTVRLPSRNGAAHASFRAAAPHKRPKNGPYDRRGKSSRSLEVRKVQRPGFLRRALLFLFGARR